MSSDICSAVYTIGNCINLYFSNGIIHFLDNKLVTSQNSLLTREELWMLQMCCHVLECKTADSWRDHHKAWLQKPGSSRPDSVCDNEFPRCKLLSNHIIYAFESAPAIYWCTCIVKWWYKRPHCCLWKRYSLHFFFKKNLFSMSIYSLWNIDLHVLKIIEELDVYSLSTRCDFIWYSSDIYMIWSTRDIIMLPFT